MKSDLPRGDLRIAQSILVEVFGGGCREPCTGIAQPCVCRNLIADWLTAARLDGREELHRERGEGMAAVKARLGLVFDQEERQEKHDA